MLSQFDLIVDRFSDNVDCTYEQISTRMEAGCTSTRYNLPNMTLTHVTALRVLLPIEKRFYGINSTFNSNVKSYGIANLMSAHAKL